MKKPPAHSTHATILLALMEVERIIAYWLRKGSGK